MPGARPSPYPWLLAAAATALVVGSLFRGYAQTDVGFFRMFATIGLVLIGYFATRTFYAIQEGDALDRLRQALRGLPEDFTPGPALRLPGRNGSRPLVVDLTVVGRHAVHLLAVDDTRATASRAAALARRRRLAQRLWQSRRSLPAQLQGHAPPLSAALLALHREPEEPEATVEGLPLVGAGDLARRLPRIDAEAASAPLPAPVRHRLTASLRAEGERGGSP